MAGFFSDRFIEEVREKNDIVELISTYVPLQKKGGKLWGLCPFHGEKTPSFSVDSEKQFYYCFGCHAGGDVIRFVREMEHLEFGEAVRLLAERARLPVPETAQGGERRSKEDKERLYQALTQAARLFNANLYKPEGEKALAYLHGRGLSDRTIRRFGLGCTAPGGESLTRQLREQGFSSAELVEANLSMERDGRAFDVFRNRVMFPIFDPRGRVIAFGGRVMGDGQPKYLNSTDTPVFNKRRNVYGLNFLKKKSFPYLRLVEGYMDVVSLYQHGVDGCVATLGTALTQEQARLLKRYNENIVVCYDGDEAGQRAIQRAIGIFQEAGVDVKVCVVPGGQDPDEFVRDKGGQALIDLPCVESTAFRLDVAKQKRDLSSEEERAAYAEEASAILRGLSPVQTERYLKRLSLETGFERETLLRQVGASPAAPKPIKRDISPPQGKNKPEMVHEAAQRRIVLYLYSGGRLPEGSLTAEEFTDATYRRMYETLLSGGRSALVGLMGMEEDEQLRAKMAQVLSEDESLVKEDPGKQIADCVGHIKLYWIDQRISQLMAALPTLPPEEQKAAGARLNALMTQRGRYKQAGRKE